MKKPKRYNVTIYWQGSVDEAEQMDVQGVLADALQALEVVPANPGANVTITAILVGGTE